MVQERDWRHLLPIHTWLEITAVALLDEMELPGQGRGGQVNSGSWVTICMLLSLSCEPWLNVGSHHCAEFVFLIWNRGVIITDVPSMQPRVSGTEWPGPLLLGCWIEFFCIRTSPFLWKPRASLFFLGSTCSFPEMIFLLGVLSCLFSALSY